MMNSEWNSCDAHARRVTDDGREVVVTCGLERHSTPADTGVEHHDMHLGIKWRYDDEETRFDDD